MKAWAKWWPSARALPTWTSGTLWQRLVLVRVWRLPVLPDRLGNPVRGPEERRLQRGRLFRGVHAGGQPVRRQIPAGSDPVEVAPVLCAGVTVYKGLKMTEARPGQWVTISGIGGLGHIAVQYALAMGLRVAAVDIADDKLALAKKHGAELRSTRCTKIRRSHPAGNRRLPWCLGHGSSSVGVRAGDRDVPAWRDHRVQRAAAGRLPCADLRGCAQGPDRPRLDRGHPRRTWRKRWTSTRRARSTRPCPRGNSPRSTRSSTR